MVMHGTDNATTGQVPLNLDLVLVGDAINWSTLITLNGSHAIITWAVVLLVIAATGVHLYDYRPVRTGTLSHDRPPIRRTAIQENTTHLSETDARDETPRLRP